MLLSDMGPRQRAYAEQARDRHLGRSHAICAAEQAERLLDAHERGVGPLARRLSDPGRVRAFCIACCVLSYVVVVPCDVTLVVFVADLAGLGQEGMRYDYALTVYIVLLFLFSAVLAKPYEFWHRAEQTIKANLSRRASLKVSLDEARLALAEASRARDLSPEELRDAVRDDAEAHGLLARLEDAESRLDGLSAASVSVLGAPLPEGLRGALSSDAAVARALVREAALCGHPAAAAVAAERAETLVSRVEGVVEAVAAALLAA